MSDEHQTRPVRSTQDVIDSVRAIHNDICISTVSCELGRVIGIHITLDDYCHIVAYPEKNGHGERIVYETMVGACDSLNGLYRGHDYLDSHFTRSGCPPRDEFAVTATTRDQMIAYASHGGIPEEMIEQAKSYYDEVVAPAVAANAPDVAPRSPWQLKKANATEAKAAFAAAHPQYADAIAALHWNGNEDGIDTYLNFSHGRLVCTFGRNTGLVQGPAYDRQTGQPAGTSQNVDDVMWPYVPRDQRKATA